MDIESASALPVQPDQKSTSWYDNDPMFEVDGNMSLTEFADGLDNRFAGLPQFHQSVMLRVVENQNLIHRTSGLLSIPDSILSRATKRLRPQALALIDDLNGIEGQRSLQLLRLGVRFPQDRILRHLYGLLSDAGSLRRQLLRFFITRQEVQILKIVGSVLSDERYQSHAVNLRGVTQYRSAIVVDRASQQASPMQIRGGLEVDICVRHIDHPARFLAAGMGVPDEVFDEYLKAELHPERQEVMERLCRFALHSVREDGWTLCKTEHPSAV